MAELIDLTPARPPTVAPRNLYPRGKARAHSRLVHVLRWVLPMIMVGTVAVLIGLVITHAARRREDTHRDAATPIEMINPHFYGRDNQGRAYALGARMAARDQATPQLVSLKYPTMTLYSDGPRPSVMTADTGVYHEDTHILYLRGHVLADNAKSSKFATDEAVVDTRTGTVSSPSALSSQGPLGDLRSNGFDVFDKGDRVIFKGGVHARLNQQ